MKKGLFIAALAIVSLASCKKERVCECTDSDTAPGYTGTTTKYTMVDVTKKTAKKACITEKSDYTFGGTTYTHTNTCTLK